MNTDPTFHRSGTAPAGRRASRVPSLPALAIHPPRQPAIPDEGQEPAFMTGKQTTFSKGEVVAPRWTTNHKVSVKI